MYSIWNKDCCKKEPVHCEWGPWRSGGCSVTCGEGVVHKKRSKRVTEQHGGNSCSGKWFSEGLTGKSIWNIWHLIKSYETLLWIGRVGYVSKLWKGQDLSRQFVENKSVFIKRDLSSLPAQCPVLCDRAIITKSQDLFQIGSEFVTLSQRVKDWSS